MKEDFMEPEISSSQVRKENQKNRTYAPIVKAAPRNSRPSPYPYLPSRIHRDLLIEKNNPQHILPVLLDNYDSEIKDFSGDNLSLFSEDNFNQHKNDVLYQTGLYNYQHQRHKYGGNEPTPVNETDRSQYTQSAAPNTAITPSPLSGLSATEREEIKKEMEKAGLNEEDIAPDIKREEKKEEKANSSFLETDADLPSLSNIINPLVNDEFKKIKGKVEDEVKKSTGYQFLKSEGEKLKEVTDTILDASETLAENGVETITKGASNAIFDAGKVLFPNETKRFQQEDLPKIRKSEEMESKEKIRQSIIERINKANKTEKARKEVNERINNMNKTSNDAMHRKSANRIKESQQYSLNPFSENFYLWH